MKKILLLCLLLTLNGCFEANDESGIKRTFCKDVPIERYQQHIGICANFGNMSRDSAAIAFKGRAIENKNTCLQELDNEEMMMVLLGLIGIMSVSGH